MGPWTSDQQVTPNRQSGGRAASTVDALRNCPGAGFAIEIGERELKLVQFHGHSEKLAEPPIFDIQGSEDVAVHSAIC